VRLRDLRLYLPEVKNRATGKSMGEHCEEMAKTWGIGRREQDDVALASHERTLAARARGFFRDLVFELDGTSMDASRERTRPSRSSRRFPPAFDKKSGRGTLTAGNSSPLTDGAAAVWVATEAGPLATAGLASARPLVDFEMAAVDLFHEGLLMAAGAGDRAPPRAPEARIRGRLALGAPRGVRRAVALQHPRARGCGVRRGEDRAAAHLRRVPQGPREPERRIDRDRAPFRRDRARILSHAVAELSARERGSRAIVSICADGGQGTVALLERA
jgi:acetyl-CoA C-acetyltransferase